jgi:8-oxo-dGTP pyrophosphatase MutT (NUDIX family)
MQPQFDQTEADALITRYGPTVQHGCQFHLDERGYAYWWQVKAFVRRAEVVMLVRRPDGRLLLHSKNHYPPATYRLPTGGVFWGEPVLDALAREQWEELGLRLVPVAMPGLIHYALRHAEQTIPFDSYIFLLQMDDDAVPVTQDDCEAISELCWIEPSRLPAVADHLRGVIRAWGDWGPFRAVAHDLVTEVLKL